MSSSIKQACQSRRLGSMKFVRLKSFSVSKVRFFYTYLLSFCKLHLYINKSIKEKSNIVHLKSKSKKKNSVEHQVNISTRS